MTSSKQRKGRASAQQRAGLSQGRRLNSMQVTALPLASAILACLNPAQAQEAASAEQAPRAEQPASGTLADIVVTAQKRSESLQDVPLSITALGTQQLDEMNAKTV